MKKNIKKLFLTGLAIISFSAQAVNTSGNFQVQSTLSSSCVIQTNDINFGQFTRSASGESIITIPISVTCSKDLNYLMEISEGNAQGDWLNNRTMKNSSNSDTLKYQLYFEDIPNFIIGEWGPYGYAIGGLGTGSNETHIITAKIPLNQGVSPGNYTDMLTLTVTY